MSFIHALQELEGNVDQNSVVSHWFNERFRARFVRIIPKLSRSLTNTVCMRAELHGCDTGRTNMVVGLNINQVKISQWLKVASVLYTDVVSVVIRSASNKNCWSPLASSNPCAPGDGTQFSLQSYCQGEGVMLALPPDSTIVHSCSGKCVYQNAQGFLALRDGPCDKFTKREVSSGTVVLSHQASGLCVSVDGSSSNKLYLASCTTPYSFEVTRSGISKSFK